jgi:hypothetical protein
MMTMKTLCGHMGLAVVALALPWAAVANDSGQATLRPVIALKPRPPLLPVLPQNDVLAANLDVVAKERENIATALVVVEIGHGPENPQWVMGQTQLQVFLTRLLEASDQPKTAEDGIWPHLPALNAQYKGIRILLRTADGRRFAPMMVFEGKVTAPNLSVVTPDHGREMEYYLFGTARVRRDQMLGVGFLPVYTFEQCRLMGQKIVDTTPRQCLLPDNNIVLETSEAPTLEAARMTSFNDCLKHGKALIYTFPRRCLAAGGRVLTEPPQVYEAEQAAKAKEAARLEEIRLKKEAAQVETIPENTALKIKEDGTPSPLPLPSVPSPTLAPLLAVASPTVQPAGRPVASSPTVAVPARFQPFKVGK